MSAYYDGTCCNKQCVYHATNGKELISVNIRASTHSHASCTRMPIRQRE